MVKSIETVLNSCWKWTRRTLVLKSDGLVHGWSNKLTLSKSTEISKCEHEEFTEVVSAT